MHVYESVKCGPLGDGRLEPDQQGCKHSLTHVRMEGQARSPGKVKGTGPYSGRCLSPLLPSVSLPGSFKRAEQTAPRRALLNG